MMRSIITSILILTSINAFGQNTEISDLWELYNSGNFKSTIDKAQPLLDRDLNNIELNLIIGRSYAELANYEIAIPYLENTVTFDKYDSWQKAWALGYLGTCYFMLQKYDDSEKSLNECIKLNATKNATNNAYGMSVRFGYNEFYKNWKIVESDNF